MKRKSPVKGKIIWKDVQTCFFIFYFFITSWPFSWADGFQEFLAGSEYTQILTVISSEIGVLRIIDNLQKEYFEATKYYKANPSEALMEQRRQKWFEDVSLSRSYSRNCTGVFQWLQTVILNRCVLKRFTDSLDVLPTLLLSHLIASH